MLKILQTLAEYGENTRTYLGKRYKLRLGIDLGVLLILFWRGSFTRLDPDFGWHLRSGEYILRHGIPMHDIYTYTAQSYRWVNHEWGNDVILAVIYGAGGYLLASVFYGALWTAAILLAANKRRLLSGIIAAIAIYPYVGVRPLAWTALFFSAVIRICNSKNIKNAWLLPPIFLLWANIHAGFIAGLAVIAYFAVRQRSYTLLKVLLLCAVVTLINPYGLRIYGEIAHTIFDPALHRQVEEWHSFYIARCSLLFIALWLTGLIAFQNWKKFWSWLGLSQILLISSLSASRNIPLYVIAALGELGLFIDHAWKMLSGLKSADSAARFFKSLIISAGLFLLAAFLSVTYFYDWGNRESDYPVKATAYLRAHPCGGNLFNAYAYGGYLIWKLPNQPVYIDGRMPTWRVYMNRYEAVAQHPAQNYQAEFNRYDVRCVLLKDDQKKFIKLLENRGWHQAVAANGSTLLILGKDHN